MTNPPFGFWANPRHRGMCYWAIGGSISPALGRIKRSAYMKCSRGRVARAAPVRRIAHAERRLIADWERMTRYSWEGRRPYSSPQALYESPTTRPRSREPTIEQAVVYNFTWQLTSVSAQRRHSGPHLAAFQIGLYFVPCAPHRSHLLPRSQRKLVVDVFRTRLGPIAVAQQRFRVDRRREFDHGIKRVTATDRRLAIDKRTEIGSTNRTHR